MKYLLVALILSLFVQCGSPDIENDNEVLKILIDHRYDTLNHYKEILPKRFKLISSEVEKTKMLIKGAKNLLLEDQSDQVESYLLENLVGLNSPEATNLIRKLLKEKTSSLTTIDLQLIELELLDVTINSLFKADIKYANLYVPVERTASYKIKSGDIYKAEIFMAFVRPEFPDKVFISGKNFGEIEVPRDEDDIYTFELKPDQYQEGKNHIKLKYILNDDIQIDTLTNDIIFLVE